MQESVIFQGHKYTRYPESERRSDQLYFKDHGKLLHREIWKAEYGEIPEGHHIHHKDGDPLNNSLGNLECVSMHEHKKRHKGTPITERRRKHLDRVRPLTKAWHRSEEGREWHRRHAKEAWKKRPHSEVLCHQCGEPFFTKFPTRAKYCGGACKKRAFDERHAGKNDE